MNRPYISYYVGGNDLCLKYAYFYDDKWNYYIVDDELFSGEYNDIAVDSHNHPHISYSENDFPDHNLKYAYFDGHNWHKTIVELSGDAGEKTSIVVDSHDLPHISYYDATHGLLRHAWYVPYPGIDLTSFTAKPNNDTITLNWSITTDEEISGFNLYRRITAATSVSPVRELAPPVLTDWSGKGMPGEIAQSPLQCEEGYVWTKVNTSLITGTNPYSYTDRDVLPETKYEYKLEAVTSEKSETLGTTDCTSGNENPSSFDIARIYPTPALSQINIDVIIPSQSNIDIAIYDITGRKVRTVASGLYNEGEYTLSSDISGLTNVVYIVRMTSDSGSASKNFVIAK